MTITELLCDLYDIKEMGQLYGLGKLHKDNEGTSTTINDVLENIIQHLENNQ